MIDFKQKELVEYLLNRVKEKFPEIELIEVVHSAEDPNDLWVVVNKPADEDREIAIREYASEISSDILLDYGYSILMMPSGNHKSKAA